jgi:hypothetical protein
MSTVLATNVDRLVRVSPATCAAICRGDRTELRTPVLGGAPGPSDTPGGTGFSWYPDPEVGSRYVWYPTMDGLLRWMVTLGYSPFGPDGGRVGFVPDPALGGPWVAPEEPGVACRARVIRSWVHRLDETSYDSCIRMGYPSLNRRHRAYADLTMDAMKEEVGDSRKWLVTVLQLYFGIDLIRPDSWVWAAHFEVTEVMR